MFKKLFNKFKAKEEVIPTQVEEELALEKLEEAEIEEVEIEEVEIQKVEIQKVEIEKVEKEDDEIQKVEVEVVEEVVEEIVVEKKVNLFDRLKDGLSKTKKGITDKVDQLLKSYTKVDEELFEELEEILITSDVGVNTTLEIVSQLRSRVKVKKINEAIKVKDELKEVLEGILKEEESSLKIEPSPAIIVIVGVNGVGKTTTIGKLASKFKKEGKMYF